MGNMSYCRFRNTLKDLNDCYDNINELVDGEEKRARKSLILLCQQIAEELIEDDKVLENFEEEETED